jgi:hypothetical protein
MFFHFYILIRDSQIANSKLQNKVKFSNFLKLSSVAPQIGGFFFDFALRADRFAKGNCV